MRIVYFKNLIGFKFGEVIRSFNKQTTIEQPYTNDINSFRYILHSSFFCDMYHMTFFSLPFSTIYGYHKFTKIL